MAMAMFPKHAILEAIAHTSGLAVDRDALEGGLVQ